MLYGGRQIRMRSKIYNQEKDAQNEIEYEEYSVKHEVQRYVNIFDCGGNLLNRLDMTYEQACMVSKK